MAENIITRSARPGQLLGLDAIDWSLLLGGILLIVLLALLV
jgi:hypothetical protein